VDGFFNGTTMGSANSILLQNGRIGGGGYSGQTIATATPNSGGVDLFGGTGRFGGRFFGPNAEETGGSFTLQTPDINLIGSFGAKR
jgi:hypothetical protein